MTNVYKVKPENLRALCSSILQAKGISEKESNVVAESLVDADLRGVSSHGVLRMSIYLNRLANDVINRNPDIQVVKETDSTIVLDGENGPGQVVSQRAIQLLREKAKNSPISAVTVRNSNHFGAAAYWAEQLIGDDMIGIAMSNVEPLMPPPGGAKARIGNNPLAVAVPAAEHFPVILDMATSSVPLGKILNAKSKGESIPEGWGVDKSGNSTTNPDDVVNGGSLFPVGGPKGYGLAVVVDVLSALLSNGAFGNDIHSMYNDLENPNNISHFFMAIRIDAFSDPAVFKRTVDQYIQFLKSTPKADGVNEIFLPGEIEWRNKENNLREGIILPESVVQELTEFAREAGVEANLIQDMVSVSVK